VQLKYSIHSSHLTVPARDDEQWWIVKLPDRSLPELAANEYLTMRWLRDAGMDVPRVELVTAGSVGGLPSGFVGPDDIVYLIARFDRSAAGRVHYEDFAQLADAAPEFKYGEFGVTYDSMGMVVMQLLGEDGLRTYLERLVAMVITGNTDAHLKNWALCYPDGRTPVLSPIYDFHSLTVYNRFRYAPMALSLAGEQMSGLVERRHLGELAESCGGSAARAMAVAEEAAGRLREAWAGELVREAKHRFPALADHYDRRLASLPITQP
jgi:serine/threonine-protein kinase HipA